MAHPGCRIGKIRLKSNGAEIYKLPEAQEQQSDHAFRRFREAGDYLRDEYAGALDGFCLISWKANGEWDVQTVNGTLVNQLTLPHFAAEAIRQDYAHRLAQDLIEAATASE